MALHKRVLLHTTAIAVASATAWFSCGMAFAADNTTAVGEVVVTAGRRAEALQKVPVAAVAISAAQLQTAGIQNFNDLAAFTPSLSVITGVGGNSFLNIRGVGIGVSTPFQSAGVPLVSDGLYVPRSESFLRDAYFDLDHVEVYRGPQGTFAGQNSTGGAIFLVSKQPDFGGFNGNVQQLFGDYNWLQTQAAVNLPISDKWAARFALNTETRNGFTTNAGAFSGTTPGGVTSTTSQGNKARDLGNINNLNLRAILRFKPSDNLDFRLRYDYLRSTDNGAAAVRSPDSGTFNNATSIVNPRTVFNDYLGSGLIEINRVTFNIEWHLNDKVELKSITGYQKLLTNTLADSDASSPYVQGCKVPSAAGSTTLVPAVCTQGYATQLTNENYYNQEFDLVSTGSGPLQWVIGATALKQKTPIHNYSAAYCFDPNVLAATTAQGAPVATNVCNAGLYANAPGAYVPSAAITSPGSKLDYLQASNSQAIFGEIKYNFTPKWQLIVGGRYTRYHIELEPGSNVSFNGPYYNNNPNINAAYLQNYAGYGGSQTNSVWTLPGGHTTLQSCGVLPGSTNPPPPGAASAPNLCILQAQATFKAPTGRVVLNWTPTDKTTIYASWSKGFKQGSYTTQFTVQSAGVQPQYKQEDIYDYELGLKTSLLDGHVRLTANAFYEDYRNYQASFRIVGAVIPRSINIDKATIQGFEGSVDGVFGALRTTLSVGYTDSKVKKNSGYYVVPANEFGPGLGYGTVPSDVKLYDCTTNASVPNTTTANACMNFIGRPLNYSPKWTVNATAQYDFNVLGGTLTPWAQLSYIGAQWDALFHASQDYIPGHTLGNVRLTYTAAEHWSVELFATNVTNKLYVQGVSAGSGATPYSTLVSIGAPRQVGTRIRYAF